MFGIRLTPDKLIARILSDTNFIFLSRKINYLKNFYLKKALKASLKMYF